MGLNATRAGATAVALGVIMLTLVSVPISSASPVPGTGVVGSSGTVWAYGGTHNGSVDWQGQHGQFIGTASYGFSTILTQTNTSNSTYSLTENHTVGVSLQLTYCQPNCTSARFTAQFDARAWEQWTNVALLTTAGSVTLANGTSVPALALLQSSTQAAANLSESLTVGANGTTRLVDELFVAVAANASIGFSPALGLIPLNMSSVQSWSASSEFTSMGSWQASYLLVRPFVHSNGTSAGNLSGEGNVTLFGSQASGRMHVGGQTWNQVVARLGDLTLRHGSRDLGLGLDLEDGFAFIPRAANIWSNTGTWGSGLAVTPSADTSEMDVSASAGGHLGFDSAQWRYATNVDQYDVASNASPSIVQGGPMSPTAAQESAACLTGAGCTGVSAGPTGPALGAFGPWLIAGLAAAVIAGVLTLVLARRR